MVPSTLSGFTSAGVLWRGSETRAIDETGQPFLEMDLLYGEPRTGHSRTPYDAFTVRLRFGGGAAFSEARVRGRLMGQPLGGGKTQFTVMQSYDYQSNDAYAIGAQSFEAALGTTRALSKRNEVWLVGWGGLTVLGAVDSLPLGVTERPARPEPSPGGGQGISEGPRFYDYGPGSTFGASALFSRDRRPSQSSVRRPAYLFAGRRPREPLPPAGAFRPAAPGARRAWFRRVRGVLLPSELLPGSGSLAAGVSLSAVPRVSHVEHRVTAAASIDTPQRHGARLARAIRGRGAVRVVGAADAATDVPRRPRACGWWPAARLRPCEATVRPAKRTSLTVTRAACLPTSGIA